MSADPLRLDLQSLSAQFPENTFASGLALYRSQQVIDCVLTRVNTREWGLEGIVLGGQKARQRHQVSVVLEASSDGDITFFSGNCDCGAGSKCRHSAALAVKAAYRSGQTPSPAKAAVVARPVGPSMDLFAEPAPVLITETAPVNAEPAIAALKPSAHLHIEAMEPELLPRRGLFSATLRFNYGGLLHYALNDYNPVRLPSSRPGAVDGQELLHRDLPAEHAAHDQLRLLGLAGDTRGQFIRPFISAAQQQPWLQWLDDDFSVLRAAGFEVTAAPELASRIVHAGELVARLDPDAGDLADIGARVAQDAQASWFRLSLGMQIQGARRNILPLLPELLAQLGLTAAGPGGDAGSSYAGALLQLPAHIYLQQPDGSYWRLDCEPLRPWLQALLDLLAERGGHGHDAFQQDALRLSRPEALRLGISLQADKNQPPAWQGTDSLRELAAQLAGHSALPDIPAPAGLQAALRPYQLQGLRWLQFLRSHQLGGILADDMGLGKTLQTLAHIQCEKEAGRLDRPVLIVAPLSLMGNWRREAGRFTPGLRVSVIQGHKRQRALARMGGCDIVIAPYSLLQRDRVHWVQQAWHLVVLDEAQHIKNAGSQSARVVGELNARHRLCLSGTPIENHLGELWSLFNFLMPGFLGTAVLFRALYRLPIEKQGHTGPLVRLRQRVAPFMLRRTKGEVATDLPEKQEVVASVALGDDQADLYETLRLSTEKAVRDALANKGPASSQFQILQTLTRLRQVCCDPRLLPAATHSDPDSATVSASSAKLDWLMETLPRMLAEGRRVLVFSQFTSMLALIEKALAERGMAWVTLTGQSQHRDAIIDRFTSGQVALFLISLKAGGVGLNLPQADTVIHYDPWWNPAVQEQATARAHRIGQTQPVLVYRLVAQGTIEERILALQDSKAALAGSLYGNAAAPPEPLLTEGDLTALLEPMDA